MNNNNLLLRLLLWHEGTICLVRDYSTTKPGATDWRPVVLRNISTIHDIEIYCYVSNAVLFCTGTLACWKGVKLQVHFGVYQRGRTLHRALIRVLTTGQMTILPGVSWG